MITGHIHKIYFCDGTITVIRRMLKLNSGLVIKNTFLKPYACKILIGNLFSIIYVHPY